MVAAVMASVMSAFGASWGEKKQPGNEKAFCDVPGVH